MIDLIIPYYNNPDGLKRTLASIDKNIFNITIIDDHSNIGLWNPAANQVFRCNENKGPGQARQLGINKTHNPYIMFIDTGDTFISFAAQKEILKNILANKSSDFISFSYYHNGQLTNETDNRMHGKVYSRQFINHYDITFCPKSSYMNEDVGFNRACRLCTDMTFINIPVIEQDNDPNSLTRANNSHALYYNQTRSLSIVSIHAIEAVQKHSILVEQEINQIAAALYYWFIRSAAERPDAIVDAWTGAKIFYDHFKNKICPNNLTLGNIYFQKCLQFKDKVTFPINILRFTHEILNNEIIPNKYLTYA